MTNLPKVDEIVLDTPENARRFYGEQHKKAPGAPLGFAAGSYQGCWRRYWAASHIGDMQGSSVLDIGCGYGDLLPFMVGAGVRSYRGTDVVEEYIEVARNRWQHVGDRVDVSFSCVTGHMNPVIPFADWVVMLGTAGYGTVDYTLHLLACGFRCAAKGLVFSVCHEFIETAVLLQTVRKLTSKYRVLSDVWRPDQVLYLYRDDD